MNKEMWEMGDQFLSHQGDGIYVYFSLRRWEISPLLNREMGDLPIFHLGDQYDHSYRKRVDGFQKIHVYSDSVMVRKRMFGIFSHLYAKGSFTFGSCHNYR